MAYIPTPPINPGDLGTSAWATIVQGNFDASSVAAVAALGDLTGGTGANALARLAAGAAGTTLVPDAGEATGLLWQLQPAVRVYNTIDIDPATGAWVTLTFDSEEFDTDAMHAAAPNPSRLTAPNNGGGLYLIGGHVEFDLTALADPRCEIGIRILINGAGVIAQTQLVTRADINAVLSISTLYQILATNWVELQIWTSEDVDIKASLNYSPFFWATWQRPSP